MSWPLGRLIGAVLLLPLGCSLLIGPEPEPLRCSNEGQLGPPACDEGQICRSGQCQAASDRGDGGEPTSGGERAR